MSLKDLSELLKLPLKIMIAICIATALMLFLPTDIIDKLYMADFRNNYGFVIGIAFIVSLSIVLCNVIVLILGGLKMLFKMIKQHNKIKVDIQNLTTDEKNFIKRYYDNNLEEYVLTPIQPPIRVVNSIIDKLVSRNILEHLNEFELIDRYNGSETIHYITDNALKVLNKLKNRKLLK